jgi:pyruvate carboxylase
MENPTVLHIKALSFLLYNLQSQLDLPTQFHHESKELTASSAVATLLTREKGGVAVMGTGISSAGVQISATESIESTDESANDAESGSRLEVALAINSKKNSPRKLVVTAFDLSLISPFNLEALVSK